MSFVEGFNLILTVLTLVTGLVWLLDKLWLSRSREAQAGGEGAPRPPGPFVDFCVSLFPVILAVFVLRSFVVEPFRIPSGSMNPTLYNGDFILVNKFGYGLRCPVGSCKLLDIGEPHRGDVVVFRYPAQSSQDPNFGNDFIKRVIGVPGDHIQYIDKVLTVNGQKIDVQPAGIFPKDGAAQRFTENLTGVSHNILMEADRRSPDVDKMVPPGYYFMMGDNRDGSNDSRYWGFVPEANLKGRAMLIWMSWDGGPELSRFGTLIR
ncbi:MAG: signal peptidase I [Nevskia sp.]|nr:signal peptidase I [Nevskia sp.]